MNIGLPCFVATGDSYKYIGDISQFIRHIDEYCGSECATIVERMNSRMVSEVEYATQRALLDCDALEEDLESFEDSCSHISMLIDQFEETNLNHNKLNKENVQQLLDDIKRQLDDVL